MPLLTPFPSVWPLSDSGLCGWAHLVNHRGCDGSMSRPSSLLAVSPLSSPQQPAAVMDLPLRDRRALLEAIITPVPHAFEQVEHQMVESGQPDHVRLNLLAK